ncbi:hypothetical protein FIM69_02955 [Helicobacter pylori]|nr:hypothetical protein FIM82_00600 [Helicobacter pylori]TPH53880.1 hypothetical protein FIM69_02955 [Helicobacter pylori]
MNTLLLYQKSTKLILKNVLFSIKAHILFSIFPSSFLFFESTNNYMILSLIKNRNFFPFINNIIMRKIFSAFCLIIVFIGAQKLKIILNF